MKEDEVKHLEFIQAIIARMAGNSFLIKGWSVTLAAALFALAGQDANANFALIAIFPATAFWVLDAYYLRHEHLFRKLYDDVRRPMSEGSSSVERFSLSTAKYRKKVPSWLKFMANPSVGVVHGIVLLAAGVVYYLTH